MAKRKEIYERLHPETKQGGDRKSEKARRSSRKLCDLIEPADRFTSDTAKRTGRSERAIQLDAERGPRRWLRTAGKARA